MREVEYWYDIVCPFAYLASTQVDRLPGRVIYQPFLLGGVFQALGVPANLAASMPEAKRRHNERDMMRWAAHFGVPLRMPAEHPRRTVLALRAILASSDHVAATHALFRAYWVDGLDVADPAVVADLLGKDCVERAAEQKDELRRRTDEAIAKNIFGAPTFIVGAEMFWGQDRLDWVERELRAPDSGT